MARIINSVNLLNLDIAEISGKKYPTNVIKNSVANIKHVLNGMYLPSVAERLRWDVSLNRVSHCVYNLRIENSCLLGDIKIFDTKNGIILNSNLPENFNNCLTEFGFGMRSRITLDSVINNTVSSCSIIGFDFVKLR